MEKELRKYRKKLREVERLQTRTSLTEKEKIKIQQREEFQLRIAQILEDPNFNVEKESDEPPRCDEEFEFFVEHTEGEEKTTSKRMKRKSTSEESEGRKLAKLDGGVEIKCEQESEREESDEENDEALTNGFHLQHEQVNLISSNHEDDEVLCQPEIPVANESSNIVAEKSSKAQVPVPQTTPTVKPSVSSPSTSKEQQPVTPRTPPENQQKKSSPAVKVPSLEAEEKAKNIEWAKKLRFSGGEWEGHSDMLFSVDCDGTLAVSGSRDTMLKVWDCNSGRELFSLLGHSATVTCVQMIAAQILPKNTLKEIYENNNLDAASVNAKEKYCVSGSQDCSLNLWNISKGCLVQSIYTFNAISCLLFDSQNVARKDPKGAFVFTGNEAGKIQIWNLASKQEIFSVVAHEGAVMGIKKCANRMYSCAMDGLVKVWQKTAAACNESGDKSYQFIQTFASESIKVVRRGVSTTNAGDNDLRGCGSGYSLGMIRTMDVDFEEELVYIGDDGPNVKILDWKNGLVFKLRNHRLAFGYTDAVQLSGNYLLACSFYLDTGKGSINIFHRPKKSQLKDPFRSFYITTLGESASTSIIGRIFCLKFAAADNNPDLCSLVIGSSTLFNFSSGNNSPNGAGKNKNPRRITLHNKSFKWRVRVDDSDDGGVESQDNEEMIAGGSSDEEGATDQSNSDVAAKMGNMQLATRSYFSFDWCNIL